MPYYAILYISILYTLNIMGCKYIYIHIYIIYFIYYIYIHIYSICTPPQYLIRGDIETVCEYLETRSDKSISSSNLCDVASFIFKNNYFVNQGLKYHQKRGFAIGTKFKYLLHGDRL